MQPFIFLRRAIFPRAVRYIKIEDCDETVVVSRITINGWGRITPQVSEFFKELEDLGCERVGICRYYFPGVFNSKSPVKTHDELPQGQQP